MARDLSPLRTAKRAAHYTERFRMGLTIEQHTIVNIILIITIITHSLQLHVSLYTCFRYHYTDNIHDYYSHINRYYAPMIIILIIVSIHVLLAPMLTLSLSLNSTCILLAPVIFINIVLLASTHYYHSHNSYWHQ